MTVGMVQRDRGTGLALESSETLRVGGQLLRQELESDLALEPGILGRVDGAHPSGAQQLEDHKAESRALGRRCYTTKGAFPPYSPVV